MAANCKFYDYRFKTLMCLIFNHLKSVVTTASVIDITVFFQCFFILPYVLCNTI